MPALILSLLLAACAAEQSAYPSLARRPIERISTESPAPAPAVTPVPPSIELLAQIERQVDQASKADATFRSHEAVTRQLVAAAAGSAVASESWSVAIVALAGLESARSDAMIALADLDAIYANKTIAGEDVVAITAARGQIIALVENEDRVLAELRGRMTE